MTVKCGYCKQDKPGLGWHDCPQSIAGRKRLSKILIEIHELNVGGQEKWDSPEEEARRKFTKVTFDKLGE